MAVNKLIGCLVLGFCLAGSSGVSAGIIDFEDLASPDELSGIGQTYGADGYTFAYEPANGEPYPTSLHAVGESWQFNEGSTSIFANSDGASTTLTREDDSSFSLLSIDLAELNGPGATTVTFEGQKTLGELVYQAFVLDGVVGFQTFLFSNDFVDLKSVTWLQGDNINFLPHMFDNVSVELSGNVSVSVPEPSAFLLCGVGLLCLGVKRRFVS